MEQFEKQQVIKGISFFEGNIDGKDLKSGTVFIEHQLDESKGNSKGFRTVDHKAELDCVKALITHDFPMNAVVTYEMRVGKGSHVMTIIAIKPLTRAGSNPAADSRKAA